MSKKTNTVTGKVITAAAIAAAVIILVTVIVVAVNCAGKSGLTVKLGGRKLSNRDKIVIPMTGEEKFEYSADEGDIIVTVSISEDFEYFAAGERCRAKDLDLTPLFISDETKTESGFTLQCTQGKYELKKVLSAAHGGAEISGDIPELSYPFRLTVATTTGKQLSVYFVQINLALSQTEYVF